MAGSALTVTNRKARSINCAVLAWTSDDTTGDVSIDLTVGDLDGEFAGACLVHSGVTDLYDIALTHKLSAVNIFSGLNGTPFGNVATANPANIEKDYRGNVAFCGDHVYTLDITNAGNSKTGTIYLFYR